MAAKKGGLGKGLDSLLVNKVNADHSSELRKRVQLPKRKVQKKKHQTPW